MNNTLNDKLLDELAEMGMLSTRSVNICFDAELYCLSRILDYYHKNGTFMKLRNCGSKVDRQLTNLCKKYDSEKPESYLEKISSLTQFQKDLLNSHFKHLTSKLSARSLNGLIQIDSKLTPSIIFEKIFADNFDYNDIKNLGFKSITELKILKLELIECILLLKNSTNKDFSRGYLKIIFKSTFKNSQHNFEEFFQEIIDENGKIKLFSSLDYLIKHGEVFSDQHKVVFMYSFTKSYTNEYNYNEIARVLNITKERVRQINSSFKNQIQNYLIFISNIAKSDIVDYDINQSNQIICIDEAFLNNINFNESVNFNIDFYLIIFKLLFNNTHLLLGSDNIFCENINNFDTYNFKNIYLIKKELYELFDFDRFASDIQIKLSSKILDSYSLDFKLYLYDYYASSPDRYNEEIHNICEIILLKEFQLIVNNNGYINFERTTKKQVREYCYEILDNISSPMKVKDILINIKSKYPDFASTIESIRSSLNREKDLFMYFGRTGTYGLKKWENENIKGGTIRDIVEEYLLEKKSPLHITEIVKHVIRFRPDTNKTSILTNLKSDKSKKFKFYKNEVVGLVNMQYHNIKIKELGKAISWKEKFNNLILFREKNKERWPSGSSSDSNERSLYLMCYRARKAYLNGKLDKTKEQMYRQIGLNFDDNSPDT